MDIVVMREEKGLNWMWEIEGGRVYDSQSHKPNESLWLVCLELFRIFTHVSVKIRGETPILNNISLLENYFNLFIQKKNYFNLY